MRIGLVTDSNSDLPRLLTQRYKIEVVPSILVIDGQSYFDEIDITRQDFYTRLPGLLVSPTTASPSGRDFSARYQKLFESGCKYIIGIFTAEKLSAIADIARQAAEDFAGKITVIESGSLSMGTGYQVLAAADSIERGLPLAEVLANIHSVRQRLKTYAALDTIEYLRRSGRVPQAVSKLGGLLRIKPVIELHEGVVRAVDAPRTTRHATEKLLNQLADLAPYECLSILHTNAESRAREFLADLEAQPGNKLPAGILIINVTTVIGTHLGPNALGFAVIRRML